MKIRKLTEAACNYVCRYKDNAVYECDGKYTCTIHGKTLSASSEAEIKDKIDSVGSKYRNHYKNLPESVRKIRESLIVTRETDLTDFDFWSGAVDRARCLTDDELRTISNYLCELYPEGMSDTAINDFFWFEEDTIAEWLGYDSFDEIYNRDALDESLSDRIRKGNLDYDGENDSHYAEENGTHVQFQDREQHTHEFRTEKNRWGKSYVAGKYNKQPKVSSHTWGRVWKDGVLDKSFEGPKYQVRADVAKYLDEE